MSAWNLMTVSSSMLKQPDSRQAAFKLPTSGSMLADVAIAADDVYSAAAVYAVASTWQQKALRSVMFGKRRDVLMLARWEHTPTAVLQAMWQGSDVLNDHSVQLRLLRNANTPAQSLIKHSQQVNAQSLLGLISQHPQAPAVLLKQIAVVDEDTEHLKSVCRNQAADSEVLQALLDRASADFDRDIVANPHASAQMLHAIYRRGDPYVRAAVLGHQACPADLLDVATDDDELVVQRQLARDERLGLSKLQEFAKHEDAAVRATVAANRGYPAEQLSIFVVDTSPAVRRALAAREDLSDSLMRQLSGDEDAWVRQWLGRNPALRLDLMWELAADPVLDVRRAVARNTHCPAILLEKLAADESGWVRAAVAYQSNAGRELMMQLFRDTDIDVLSGVASNPKTPMALLKRLAKHEDADVRRGVILNPTVKREVLLPMLEDPYYLHRVLLTGHKKLTEADKWPLHEDPDNRVRFSVFKWFADRLGGV